MDVHWVQEVRILRAKVRVLEDLVSSCIFTQKSEEEDQNKYLIELKYDFGR